MMKNLRLRERPDPIAEAKKTLEAAGHIVERKKKEPLNLVASIATVPIYSKYGKSLTIGRYAFHESDAQDFVRVIQKFADYNSTDEYGDPK